MNTLYCCIHNYVLTNLIYNFCSLRTILSRTRNSLHVVHMCVVNHGPMHSWHCLWQIGLSTRLELVKRSQRICQTRLKQDPMDTGFQEFKAELEIGCKHLKILTSSEFENITTIFSIDEVCSRCYKIITIHVHAYRLLPKHAGKVGRIFHWTGLFYVRPKQGIGDIWSWLYMYLSLNVDPG